MDIAMIKTTNEFLTMLNDELTKVYIKEKESKGTLEEFM